LTSKITWQVEKNRISTGNELQKRGPHLAAAGPHQAGQRLRLKPFLKFCGSAIFQWKYHFFKKTGKLPGAIKKRNY
jgi:hypothetical protein